MKCKRCSEEFGAGYRCQECGVALGRPVRKHRSRRTRPGKRGRNSGKVSQHGKKK
jgi:hypothetical protein